MIEQNSVDTDDIKLFMLIQCSCLENPRDGGAWWAAIYGVTQSRTRLKQLSSSSREVQTNGLHFRPHGSIVEIFREGGFLGFFATSTHSYSNTDTPGNSSFTQDL